jgi:hypothetical protein
MARVSGRHRSRPFLTEMRRTVESRRAAVHVPKRRVAPCPQKRVRSAYALEEAKRNLSSGQQQAELEQLYHSVGVVSIIPPEGEVSIFDHRQTHLIKPQWYPCLSRYGPF